MKSLVKALSVACIAGTLFTQSSLADLSQGNSVSQNGKTFVSRLTYKYLSNHLKFKAKPVPDTAQTIFLLGFALCGVEIVRRNNLRPA
jgi:hypothetical protein